MTSSNAQAWYKKFISLNNLGSKYSLLIKFGQFMSYYKKKKKKKKNENWKLVSGPFVFEKN